MTTVKEVDAAMQAAMNYWGVQSNSVQAIRRALCAEIKSFFKAWEQWKKNPHMFRTRFFSKANRYCEKVHLN